MFSLVFTRRFSMAHRLIADPAGKCAIPHGHNEQVIARLQPVAPQRLDGRANMVVPFDRAKACWRFSAGATFGCVVILVYPKLLFGVELR